jgi:hypothetical protein
MNIIKNNNPSISSSSSTTTIKSNAELTHDELVQLMNSLSSSDTNLDEDGIESIKNTIDNSQIYKDKSLLAVLEYIRDEIEGYYIKSVCVDNKELEFISKVSIISFLYGKNEDDELILTINFEYSTFEDFVGTVTWYTKYMYAGHHLKINEDNTFSLDELKRNLDDRVGRKL